MMAFFGVTYERIAEVWAHPNADALSLGRLEGMDFQFVMKLNEFSPGDEVVYFPIDSLMPDTLAKACNVFKRLAGAQKNRLKTIRLRGELSQGLITSTETLERFLSERGDEDGWREEWSAEVESMNSLGEPIMTNALTVRLGVIKYEAPSSEKVHQGARLSTLPSHLSKYDIEDASRYATRLMNHFDDGFVVTLKLEGSNFCVGYYPQLPPEQQVYVCSRNHLVKADPELPEERRHYFLKYVELHQLGARVRAWADQNHPGKDVSLYGEMLGPQVQKNLYNLKEHQVVFFDVKIGGEWVDYLDFKRICVDELGFHIAPEVLPLRDTQDRALASLLEELDLRALSEVTEDQETITGEAHEPIKLVTPRKIGRHEGVVIKPLREARDMKLGRVILKKRNPDYLDRSGL